MSISLSTFIRSDQFIIKQPRVSTTNSVDTLPVKTRSLEDTPVYPLPNNIGEVGSYPYILDNETPVGDEKTGVSDYAVEYIVWVTDEGSSKIVNGDIEISYARNSAWQTKFEFKPSLNRWSLISDILGVITNSPRLKLSDTRINDFTLRPNDFTIKIANDYFTVIPVLNETFFIEPAQGEVYFSQTELTLNFNPLDLNTYSGKDVIYDEVLDGSSTIASNGTATLERGIELIFQPNNLSSKKDLSLDFTFTDQLLLSNTTNFSKLPLSFTPIDPIILYYDPIPSGYNNPLILNEDYVVDLIEPSILFCRVVSDEVVLSDFNTNPQTSNDPDSSKNIYENLSLNQHDIVPNTLSLVNNTISLVEDQDYLLNLDTGIVSLTYGLTEELLLNNIFLVDTPFATLNFSLFINDVEVTSYLLTTQSGWISLDTPLYEGDVITADYVIEGGTSYVGDYVKTPSIEIPSAGRLARIITPEEPAIGGETSFTVQHTPIKLNRFSLDIGQTILSAENDRTALYRAGVLIKINEDIYSIIDSTYSDNITSIELGSPTIKSYLDPDIHYTKYETVWENIVATHLNIPEGATSITLINEGINFRKYPKGILIKAEYNIYTVKGASVQGSDLTLILNTKLVSPISSSDTIEKTLVPILTESDESLNTIYLPIIDIPNKYDDNQIIPLDTRFPTIGGSSIRIIRNGSDLTDLEYTISNSGKITFKDLLSSNDDNIIIRYIPYKFSDIGDEILATYTYYTTAPSNVSLYGSMSYQVPDTFYFRVVNNTTQADIYQKYLKELMKQKSGQVSSGSTPTIEVVTGNHIYGLSTPVTDVGDLYDNDIISQRIYEFLTTRIEYLENEKMELSGEIPGGYGGPLTSSDLADSARGTGRLFPINSDILLSILKKGQDIALPSRPYRLPVLFGLAVEDDFSRIVLSEEYPKIPITSFPPFPPQGEVYKGSNQEPNAYNLLGLYSTSYAASAPTTFIESWHPYSLDYTYINPLTSTPYVDYSGIEAFIETDTLEVSQDSGNPSNSVPVFPPQEKELDPIDFIGFDPTLNLPTYVSVAPRSISKSYEGMAIGALQEIDTLIEFGTLKGYAHREIPGDVNSYPDFLGWVYRDKNEFELISTGSLSETVLLQNEWLDVLRPNSLTDLTDNAKQQLLVLSLEKESLEKQIVYLESLLNQIEPLPMSDPELTTITQAQIALDSANENLDYVILALSNLQDWYNSVIVNQLGVATDQQIRDRWTFITGVDVSLISPPLSLPLSPITLDSRILQVSNRITYITTRLGEINNTLGFDGTVQPDFSNIATSENLYTQRYTFLDLRVNRESGTLFKALAYHSQFVRDTQESKTLSNIVTLLGG